MKIGIGEKKIFEVKKNTMTRDQFDLLAKTCGKFNAENGTGLVGFKNGTKVLFLKDEETGLRVAYGLTIAEDEHKGRYSGTAKLITDIEVKDGKMNFQRSGRNGKKSDIEGDELAKLAGEAKDKKAALEKISKKLDNLQAELDKIIELQEPAKKLYDELLEASNDKLTAKENYDNAVKALGNEKNPEKDTAWFKRIAADKAYDEIDESINNPKEGLQAKYDNARNNYNNMVEQRLDATKELAVLNHAKKELDDAKKTWLVAGQDCDEANRALGQAEQSVNDARNNLNKADAAYENVNKEVEKMKASYSYTEKYFDPKTSPKARETYFEDLANAKAEEVVVATEEKNKAQKAYGATFIGAVENILAQDKFNALRQYLAGNGFIHGIFPAPIKEGGYLVVIPETENWNEGRGKFGESNLIKANVIYVKKLEEEKIANLVLCESAEEFAHIVGGNSNFQVVDELITTKNGKDSGIYAWTDPTKDEAGHHVSKEHTSYLLTSQEAISKLNEIMDKIRYDICLDGNKFRYEDLIWKNVDQKQSSIYAEKHNKHTKRGWIAFGISAALLTAGAVAVGAANLGNQIKNLGDANDTILRNQFILGAENTSEEATKLGTNQKNGLNLLDGSKNGEANIKFLHFEDLPAYDQPNPVKCTNQSTGEVKYLELTPEEKQQVAMNYNYDEAQFGKGLSYTLGYSFAGDLAKEAASNENIRLGTYSQESGEWTYTTKYVDMVADMYKNEPRFYANYFAEGYMEGVKTLDKTTAAGFPDPNFDITQAAEDLGYDKVLGGEGDTFYTLKDTTLTEYTEDPEYKLADAKSPADLEKAIDHATLVREYEEMSAEYGIAFSGKYASDSFKLSDRANENHFAVPVTEEGSEKIKKVDSVSVTIKGSSNNEKLMTAMGFVYADETQAMYEYTWDCSKFGNESTVKVYADLDAYNASPYAADAELGN